MVSKNTMLLLTLGGALGTFARYILSGLIGTSVYGFPLGTVVVNVSGCFLLGMAAAAFRLRMPVDHEHWFLILGTGFCGGYTTFSTFELETYELVHEGKHWVALANILVSVVAGFVGVWLGITLINVIDPRP